MLRSVATLFLACNLFACAAIPTSAERRAHADKLAEARVWRSEVIPAGQFNLVAYVPQQFRQDPLLTVYIEGDGFAWVSGSTPSADPTPREPLALRLALAQPAGNAAYLGRPCQYGDAEQNGCPQRYWTEARFAPEVVAAQSKAIDVLKERFGAIRLTLVGYSGGGAVAALLAARRSDIDRLITVAGNLDHQAWTRLHRVEPLNGSLNPADDAGKLLHVRQWHFVGSGDRSVPPGLAVTFAERFPPDQRPTVIVMPGFNHQCCWVDEWKGIWQTIAR